MNNSKLKRKWPIWIVSILSITIVALLLFQLFRSESINSNLSISKSTISEKCVDCHQPSDEMSFWHRYERIGCVSCHQGNADESDITAAHAGMISIPGNLSNSRQSCGSVGCHPGITERVESSLMTSMSGVVNIQRYFFGESDTLDAHVHVRDLGYSPADSYARNLCASCHLGREKLQFGPVNEKTRGGGCNACHLNYSDQAAQMLAEHKEGQAQHFHPSLSLNISNDHCFGCHSRSGRISTSYEGWHETQLKTIPDLDKETYRKLMDGRIMVKISEDVHHELGLECIDCHSGMEVMGDGRKYYHAEEAVRVRCFDCHFDTPPQTTDYEGLDYESQKIVDLRPQLEEKMTFVLGRASGYPLVNVIESGNEYYFHSKNSGKRMPLSAPAEICTRGDAHDDLSCSACHTAWAPQCIKCHVDFDPNQSAFDLLARERVMGKWIETGGHYLAEAPTLGVMYKRKKDGSTLRKIESFIPGMIINADPSSYEPAENKSEKFARFYAPIEAHTTTKNARDCKSCHLNPNALGYGRGSLTYDLVTKQWLFNPLYGPKKEDGLPEDAWIGLFEDAPGNRSTRVNGRPFNRQEQESILSVGICLQCHADDSRVMLNTLSDFESSIMAAKESEACLFE
jgi:hypothetical protein